MFVAVVAIALGSGLGDGVASSRSDFATADLTVLVMPVRAGPAESATARTVLDQLSAEFTRRSARALTVADVETLFGAERLRAALVCDEAICAAELGDAVGADRVLMSTLIREGREWVIALDWFDVRYARSLAVVSEPTGRAAALARATARAVDRLLERSRAADLETSRQVANPKWWTIEISGGFGTRNSPEPYKLGFNATARLGFGGLWPMLGWFFYGLGGVQVSHLAGDKSAIGGRISYQRSQLTPFIELRTAAPIANQRRTRLIAGLGAGATWETSVGRRGRNVVSEGDRWSPELRAIGGVWHQISFRHSVFGAYRLRMQFEGERLDAITELARPGETDPVPFNHALEIGWAFHF